MYIQSQELCENKAISCPDQRCALSFNSIQDLQCYCQDVHCIQRNKLNQVKRRCQAHQPCTDEKDYVNSDVQPKRQSNNVNKIFLTTMSMKP